MKIKNHVILSWLWFINNYFCIYEYKIRYTLIQEENSWLGLNEMSLQVDLFNENFGIPNSSRTYDTSEASCYKTNLSIINSLWDTICCGPWIPASSQYSLICWSIALQTLTILLLCLVSTHLYCDVVGAFFNWID